MSPKVAGRKLLPEVRLTGKMMDKCPQVSAKPRLSMPLQVEKFWNRMMHFNMF